MSIVLCEDVENIFFINCRLVGTIFLLFLISDINALGSVSCEVKIRDDPFDSRFDEIRTQTVYCEFDDAISVGAPSTLSNSANENVTELLLRNKKQIEYLPQHESVPFPNLNTINAYGCSVKSLTKLNFNGLTKLSNINLNSNQIETIDENSFDDTIELAQVDLDNNKLVALPSRVFEKLKYLKGLFLKNNQIQSLDAALFKNAKNIVWLILTDNKLTTLPAGIFEGLTKMRQLWLNGNEIEDLPPHIFDDCSSLKDLDLSRNKIKFINANWLLKLSPLREVTFSRNPLNFIDLTIFDNNINLIMFEFNGVATKDIRHIEKVDQMANIRGIGFHETCVNGQFRQENLDELKQSVKENCIL